MSLLNSGPAAVRARGGAALRGRALLVTCLAVFVASTAAAPAVIRRVRHPRVRTQGGVVGAEEVVAAVAMASG